MNWLTVLASVSGVKPQTPMYTTKKERVIYIHVVFEGEGELKSNDDVFVFTPDELNQYFHEIFRFGLPNNLPSLLRDFSRNRKMKVKNGG